MSDTVKVDRKLKWAQNAVETITCHNKSGGTVAPGDLVIFDSANSTDTEVAFTTTAVADNKMVLGVCIENMASNGYGEVQTKGPIGSIVKVNGTTDISIGDLLSTYSTKKIGQQATAGKGGAFAVALEAYSTDDSSGTIKAWLTGGASRVDTSSQSASYASPTLTGAISMNGATAFNATGVITCTGVASETDTIVVELGDITITDGKLSVTDVNGTTDIVTFATTTGVLATDVAILDLTSAATMASGSNMLRLDPSGGTANAGAILLEIVGAAQTCQAMYIDADCTAKNVAQVHGGGALADGYAVLSVTSDGAIATGGALLNLTYSGSPGSTALRMFEIADGAQDVIAMYIDSDAATESAIQITGAGSVANDKAMLHVANTSTTAVSGASLLRLDGAFTTAAGNPVYGITINLTGTYAEALYVEAGTSTFAEAITIQSDSRLNLRDTSQYIYSSAANKIELSASTWVKILSGPFVVGVDGVGYDTIFYGTGAGYLVWYDIDGDTSGTWYFGANQKGVDVFWYGATASNYMQWDKSAELFKIVNTTKQAFNISSALTGAAALNAVKWAIGDATTNTSAGYNAAFLCEVTVTGAMTPTEYTGSRFNLLLNTGTKTGIYNALKAKIGTGGVPILTGATLNGIHISMDEMGACNRFNCMMLETANTTNTDNSAFFDMRSQGSAVMEAVFYHQGTNRPLYFWRDNQNISQRFAEAGDVTSGKSCTGGFRCLFGSTVVVIPFYAD